MLGQAEPKLRHGEPVRLRLKRGRILCQLEAALRPRPEFFGKFHRSYDPSLPTYQGPTLAFVPIAQVENKATEPDSGEAVYPGASMAFATQFCEPRSRD
jgi:hypothetical protein